MSDFQSTTTEQEHTPFCRWQVRIHDCGRDIVSPEFETYVEMRKWESEWYKRNTIR